MEISLPIPPNAQIIVGFILGIIGIYGGILVSDGLARRSDEINTRAVAEQEARLQKAAIERAAKAEEADKQRHAESMAIQNEILERLQKTNETIGDKLLGRYPLGYTLFYADSKAPLTIDPHNPGIEVDWSTVSVVEVTKTHVMIKPPQWADTKQFADISKNFTIGISRMVGATFSPFKTRTKALVFETLSVLDDGVIAVAGFTELPTEGTAAAEKLQNMPAMTSDEEILAFLRKQETAFSSAFQAFYPFGYGLIYAEPEKYRQPYALTPNGGNVEIDWGSVDVLPVTDDEVGVMLPGWSFRDSGAKTEKGDVIKVKRELGAITGPIESKGLKASLIYLATVGKNAVVLLGFSRGDDARA